MSHLLGNNQSALPIPESLSTPDVLNDASIFKLKRHDYLSHIIQQVEKEGFYAVRCAQFMQNNHLFNDDLALIVNAVNHWATQKRLNASFNHHYGICVFEQNT